MTYYAPRLLAIDPFGCGCTECLSGQYHSLDRATDEDIQALLGGVLRDNTGEHFVITERTSRHARGFDVTVGDRTFTIDSIALPIAVERYEIHLSKASFEKVMEGGGYPHVLDFD